MILNKRNRRFQLLEKQIAKIVENAFRSGKLKSLTRSIKASLKGDATLAYDLMLTSTLTNATNGNSVRKSFILSLHSEIQHEYWKLPPNERKKYEALFSNGKINAAISQLKKDPRVKKVIHTSLRMGLQ